MARHYAREIVPSFSAYAYFGIGARLARWVSTLLYRVRLGYMDEDALKTVDPDSAVIFVINHRSNMDYVLVTYMASTSSALSYAVGEWARIWLLQSLVRSMGAYFVRRDSRDPLYRKVLARYVHMAVAGGLAQAVFPEGGLTRDGRLGPPKLGLIGYMVSGFDPKGARDAVFVPVGINYDRVLEDRLQLGSLARKQGGEVRHRFNLVFLLKALVGQIALALRGRWYRFGYACVSFGAPLSLRQYVKERGIDFRMLDQQTRFAEVEQLANVLMQKVGGVVPVLPVALVATALLEAGEALSMLELKVRVLALVQRLATRGCACAYSARRPGLCHRSGLAHVAPAPSGRGARRSVPDRGGGRAAVALLRQLDCASAGCAAAGGRINRPNCGGRRFLSQRLDAAAVSLHFRRRKTVASAAADPEHSMVSFRLNAGRFGIVRAAVAALLLDKHGGNSRRALPLRPGAAARRAAHAPGQARAGAYGVGERRRHHRSVVQDRAEPRGRVRHGDPRRAGSAARRIAAIHECRPVHAGTHAGRPGHACRDGAGDRLAPPRRHDGAERADHFKISPVQPLKKARP